MCPASGGRVAVEQWPRDRPTDACRAEAALAPTLGHLHLLPSVQVWRSRFPAGVGSLLLGT